MFPKANLEDIKKKLILRHYLKKYLNVHTKSKNFSLSAFNQPDISF